MAIEKKIDFNGSGVIADYWEIVGISIDILEKKAIINLGLYVSEEHKKEGRRPLGVYPFYWNLEENKPFPVDIFEKKGKILDNLEELLKEYGDPETNIIYDTE